MYEVICMLELVSFTYIFYLSVRPVNAGVKGNVQYLKGGGITIEILL